MEEQAKYQPTELMVPGQQQLQTFNRAEVDMQIATAKRYPRVISEALNEAKTLATMDTEMAESCGYLFERAGKKISGPSIRCAEIMEYAWGNIRCGARVLEMTAQHVTAEGYCFDLEKNICNQAVKTVKLEGKGGKFNADLVALTCDRCCALAKRNAIFATVPSAYVEAVYRAAMDVSLGNTKSLVMRRQQLLEKFIKNWGITAEQVCAYIGRAKIEDITLDDLETIICLGMSIKDGEISVDEVINAAQEQAPVAENEAENLADAMAELNAITQEYGISSAWLKDAAKMFKRPLSKLTASEIQTIAGKIKREFAKPKTAQDSTQDATESDTPEDADAAQETPPAPAETAKQDEDLSVAALKAEIFNACNSKRFINFVESEIETNSGISWAEVAGMFADASSITKDECEKVHKLLYAKYAK